VGKAVAENNLIENHVDHSQIVHWVASLLVGCHEGFRVRILRLRLPHEEQPEEYAFVGIAIDQFFGDERNRANLFDASSVSFFVPMSHFFSYQETRWKTPQDPCLLSG